MQFGLVVVEKLFTKVGLQVWYFYGGGGDPKPASTKGVRRFYPMGRFHSVTARESARFASLIAVDSFA